MALIAAFGMYDRPELAGAHDRLWAGVRDALRDLGHDAPQGLTRGEGAYMAAWTSQDLLIAQTCSLPLRAKLAGQVQLVASPDYGLAGCPAGYYRSVYVARKGGPQDVAQAAGMRFAYNEALSHSGWAAPHSDHAARGLALRPTLQTGAHGNSARAVAMGRADYAALDALTWEMICAYDDFAGKLQVIGHTLPSPALPFITAKTRNPAPLRAALAAGIAGLDASDRAALHLQGLRDIPLRDYLKQPIPPAPIG